MINMVLYNATLQVSPCTIQFLFFVQKLRLNELMRSIIGQYNKSGMVAGNAIERYAPSGPKKLTIPPKQKHTTNNSEVLPSTLLLLRRFCLKTGIHFAHFGLESGMVFEGTKRVYERIYRFNSKWVRKKEKYANSKWILRIFVAVLI